MAQLFDVMQVGEETFAVVHFGTEEVVVLNGVPQIGLSAQDADDLAEALDVQHGLLADRGNETRN